ncbi:MAG: putative Ig domain-containing protein [Bryobacterales bacterium]|nr:putative Ig domain-containing protein [Bryobacterales bacterium]
MISQGYTIRVLGIQNPAAALPPGLVGSNYSHSFSAWGLNPSFSPTWSASGLPPGLSMSVSGQISGSPTTPGNYAGTVTITEGSRVASRAINITIAGVLSFAPPYTFTATVGVPFSRVIQTTGGLPPVTVVAETNTPTLGLMFHPSTKTISGTPTGVGTYAIDLIAGDAGQQNAFGTFYVTITQPSGLITTESLPAGSVHVPYSATLTSSGFVTAPVWSATGLPPSLTLNPSTGVISGTPTADGAYGVTFNASTQTQSAAPKTLVIAIGPPTLDFTPGTLPGGVVGAPYSAAFTATGGDGTYVFAPVSGLPPGLTLSASGAVTGTPTAGGDYKFAVRVTSAQQVTEKAITMTVDAAAMGLTPATLAAGYTGEAYSQTFVASGGTAPYVFQFGQTSQVPPGLSLSSSGVLSGTPTAAGTFRIGIEVSDAKQRRLQRDYTVVVTAQGAITTTALPDGTEGEAYRAVIEAAGGTGPFVYDLAAGALPGGLTLSTSGEIAGTVTTPGRFTFTVRAMDANERTATRDFSIQVFAVIAITPDSVPNAGLLKDYSAQLTATGGQPAYIWQISAGALPEGIAFSGGVFRGAATRAGTFAFDVTATDQRKRSATKRYSIVVAEGPSIQIDGTVPDGVVGVSYAARFTPKGGRAPFRWSVNGQLPTGLNLGAADGSITGVPTAAGVFNFTLRLEDADALAASAPFRITVVQGTVPSGAITGISGTTGPSNQLTFGVTTAAPFPTTLDGAVALAFQPDSGADDPAVLFSNGSRRMPFTVPAGSTVANFPVGRAAVQTGTVAGLITMTGSFSLNGVDVTPRPAPVSTLRIDPAPPVITRMDAVRTSTGFELSIYGFTTARQIAQARVTLTPTAGFTLASTQFTLELGTLFTTYYGSAAAAPFGSQFKLVLPFTLSEPLAVASVSVTLVNAQGSSAPSAATF